MLGKEYAWQKCITLNLQRKTATQEPNFIATVSSLNFHSAFIIPRASNRNPLRQEYTGIIRETYVVCSLHCVSWINCIHMHTLYVYFTHYIYCNSCKLPCIIMWQWIIVKHCLLFSAYTVTQVNNMFSELNMNNDYTCRKETHWYNNNQNFNT